MRPISFRLATMSATVRSILPCALATSALATSSCCPSSRSLAWAAISWPCTRATLARAAGSLDSARSSAAEAAAQLGRGLVQVGPEVLDGRVDLPFAVLGVGRLGGRDQSDAQGDDHGQGQGGTGTHAGRGSGRSAAGGRLLSYRSVRAPG